MTSEVLLYNINPTLGSWQRTLTSLISLVLQYFSFLRAPTEPVESKFSSLVGPTQNMQVCCTWVLSRARTDLLRVLVTYQLTTIYQYQKEIKPTDNPCNSVKSPINWRTIEFHSRLALLSSSSPYPNWHWVVRVFQVSVCRRLFIQIKLPERDAYNLPPSSTEVTNLKTLLLWLCTLSRSHD
jgi:hypothetical protein